MPRGNQGKIDRGCRLTSSSSLNRSRCVPGPTKRESGTSANGEGKTCLGEISGSREARIEGCRVSHRIHPLLCSNLVRAKSGRGWFAQEPYRVMNITLQVPRGKCVSSEIRERRFATDPPCRTSSRCKVAKERPESPAAAAAHPRFLRFSGSVPRASSANSQASKPQVCPLC